MPIKIDMSGPHDLRNALNRISISHIARYRTIAKNGQGQMAMPSKAAPAMIDLPAGRKTNKDQEQYQKQLHYG
jgi:hypothetical protein